MKAIYQGPEKEYINISTYQQIRAMVTLSSRHSGASWHGSKGDGGHHIHISIRPNRIAKLASLTNEGLDPRIGKR